MKELRPGLMFEENMINFVESKLTKEETIEFERAFGKVGGHFYRADIYLPQGCKALDFPPRSIIETRKGLRPDSLYMLYNMFMENKANWDADNFIVIYSNREQFSFELLSAYRRYTKDHFFVYSEQEVLKGETLSAQSKPRFEKWEHKRARLIQDAQYDFSEGHNTFFFGAGLGPGVNMPTWNELLDDLLDKAQKNSHSAIGSADYTDIDQSCNHSALIIGRYIESGFADMKEFTNQMKASLYKNNPQPTSDLYKVIVEAIKTKKVEQVITFNYDDLVETALIQAKFPVHSIFDRSHYSGSDFPVYHVHGMIPQTREIESTPVLSEKEYHTLYKESFHWSNVVQLQALSSTTCFFIGLSLNDPNLRRLLDISRYGINRDSATDRPCHYALLERKPLKTGSPNPAKDAEHFAMQERMMADLGINIIWYDHGKYDEIPQILKRII